jgi:vacuolar protein sorting-associated protein 26
LGYGNSATVSIVLDDEETRTKVPVLLEDDGKEYQHLFYDGDNVSGKVVIKLKQEGKKLEHQGIKIEFLGQIGKSYLVVLVD